MFVISGIRTIGILLFLLLAAPILLPTSHQPIPTAYNNALALVLWGIFFCGLSCIRLPVFKIRVLRRSSVWPLSMALAALGLMMIVHVLIGRYGYLGTTLQGLGVLLISGATLRAGYLVGLLSTDRVHVLSTAFAYAVVALGVLNALLGWVQYFDLYPSAWWLAPLLEPGRVFANLRQPNLLAQVLALSIFSTLWIFRFHRLRWSLLISLMVILVPALSFTGSRMGLVMLIFIPFLMAWGESDWLKIGGVAFFPVLVYVAGWIFFKYLGSEGGPTFYASDRLAEVEATGLRCRYGLNSWEISWLNPVFGCGFAQFNFCWTHADLVSRAPASFDHAHNFVLHLAVEFGWPIAGFTVGVIGWWLWMVRKTMFLPQQRLVLGLVSLSLLHSMLEYPWWHLYFLLPVLLIAGFASAQRDVCTSFASESIVRHPTQRRSGGNRTWCLIALLAGIAGVYYGWSYSLLRPMYLPNSSVGNEEAFQRSSRALLFQSPVEYARVMQASEIVDPKKAINLLELFHHVSRGFMDAKFLMRYAQVAAVAGETSLAHHLLWRALQIDKNIAAEVGATAQLSLNPALLALEEYANNPVPATILIDEFFEK